MSESGANGFFMTVLDEGLPALPAHVPTGGQVPVAVWMGISYGAVTVIEDVGLESGESGPRRYITMTYAHRFGERGWESPQLLGGAEWPGGLSTWTNLGDREVVLNAGWSDSPGGWPCRQVAGFAGADARWIEVSEGLTTTMHAIAPSGAFVAIVDGDGPAIIHILDRAGAPITTYQFPHESEDDATVRAPTRCDHSNTETSSSNRA